MARHLFPHAFDCVFFWTGAQMFAHPHHKDVFEELCENLPEKARRKRQNQEELQAWSGWGMENWFAMGGSCCIQGWE